MIKHLSHFDWPYQCSQKTSSTGFATRLSCWSGLSMKRMFKGYLSYMRSSGGLCSRWLESIKPTQKLFILLSWSTFRLKRGNLETFSLSWNLRSALLGSLIISTWDTSHGLRFTWLIQSECTKEEAYCRAWLNSTPHIHKHTLGFGHITQKIKTTTKPVKLSRRWFFGLPQTLVRSQRWSKKLTNLIL